MKVNFFIMKTNLFLLLGATLFLSCSSDNSSFQISETDRLLFESAQKNAVSANEGFVRCENFVHAWLEYSDPVSGLIPRNNKDGKDFWNAKDAAADNYPFMVLTSFFVDQEMFDGKMMDMLNSEKRLTSRGRSMPVAEPIPNCLATFAILSMPSWRDSL